MNDLNIQRTRAQELADVLSGFIEEDDEGCPIIHTDDLLDALGCCGLVLQEGNDAGMAWMDDIVKSTKK